MIKRDLLVAPIEISAWCSRLGLAAFIDYTTGRVRLIRVRVIGVLPIVVYFSILITEGDMGVYGIAVLSFFSSGISIILILMCGIAVSSSQAVCGFSSLWLTVFGK